MVIYYKTTRILFWGMKFASSDPRVQVKTEVGLYFGF